MTVRYTALATLLRLAVISDSRTYKIKNSIHGVFIFLGIDFSLWMGGPKGGSFDFPMRLRVGQPWQ